MFFKFGISFPYLLQFSISLIHIFSQWYTCICSTYSQWNDCQKLIFGQSCFLTLWNMEHEKLSIHQKFSILPCSIYPGIVPLQLRDVVEELSPCSYHSAPTLLEGRSCCVSGESKYWVTFDTLYPRQTLTNSRKAHDNLMPLCYHGTNRLTNTWIPSDCYIRMQNQKQVLIDERKLTSNLISAPEN